MTTAYSNLLGLALPVTGELSGTWGDTVNDYITKYLDDAIANAQIISGSQTAVTLSKTTGASLVSAGSGATGSAQYALIRCTGNPASTLTITVDYSSLTNAQFSKTYLIFNSTSTSQSVVVRATTSSGTSTGVTITSGEKALIAWNGTDFVKIATQSGTGRFVTIEVTNIKANDGTASIVLTDSTGAVDMSKAVTMSATTQNIDLGTSQTSGTFTVGGAAQTGTQTIDQSTKTHTLNIGAGATESGATKTVNLATAGVSGSTTTMSVGSAVSGAITNLTVNATTTLAPVARSTGAVSYFTVTTPADTGLTASTEVIGSSFTAATRTWATGALTLQRERVFAAPTYAFAGASTLTTAVNVDIGLPEAGTNATITNAYALRADNTLFTGNVVLNNASAALDLTNLEVTNIKAKDGTASMTLADTTGNVTFSKATVIETTDNTNAALRVTQLGTGNAILVEDSANPDSTPFVVTAAGDVGVGASSPGYALDVQKSVANGVVANFQSTSTSAVNTGVAFRSSASNAANRNWALLANSSAFGDFVIRTSTTNGGDPVSGTDRLMIDPSGNLGLGGVTPVSALGFGQAASATGITFQSTSTTFNSGKAAVIKASISGSGNGALIFETYEGGSGGGERMRLTNTGTLNIVGAGTAGSTQAISFNGSTPVDTLVTDSSGRVGIGASSPGAKLDIVTSSTIAGVRVNNATAGKSAMVIQNNGSNVGIIGLTGYWNGNSDTNFGLYAETGSDIRFSTNGVAAPKAIIDTAGNLGLGVTPSAKLEIYSTNNAFNALQVRYNGSNDAMGFGIGNSNGFPYLGYNTKSQASVDAPVYERSNPAAQLRMDNGSFKFNIAPFGTANTTTITNLVSYTIITSGNQTDFGAANNNVGTSFTANASGTLSSGTVSQNISFNQAMTLDASGNLVIGFTSAASILHVRASSATITVDDSGDGTSKISFRPSAASYAERAALSVNYGTAEMRLAAGASGGNFFQTFYTNGTERARITSVGGFETRPAANGHAIFNEDGVDADFRVESDADTHCLFVDASANNVGIGTNAPTAKLHTQQTSAGSRVTGALLQNVGATASTAVSLDFAPHENTTAPEVLARINAIRTNQSNAPTDLVFSVFNVTLQERARITSGGDLQIANGNLVMSTSGKGIDFSATSSGTGTMTSELLADYEEGTWTPTATFATPGTVSTSLAVGLYTKVGNVVTAVGRIAITKGTASGNLVLGGLPFASNNTTSYQIAGTLSTDTFGVAGTLYQMLLASNSTVPEALAVTQSTGITNAVTASDFYATAGTLRFAFTYQI